MADSASEHDPQGAPSLTSEDVSRWLRQHQAILTVSVSADQYDALDVVVTRRGRPTLSATGWDLLAAVSLAIGGADE